MKRSKVFLGITTFLLAIVGVAAAKAHRTTAKAYSIFTSGCVSTGLQVSGTISGAGSTIKTASVAQHVAYLTGTNCVSVLRTGAN